MRKGGRLRSDWGQAERVRFDVGVLRQEIDARIGTLNIGRGRTFWIQARQLHHGEAWISLYAFYCARFSILETRSFISPSSLIALLRAAATRDLRTLVRSNRSRCGAVRVLRLRDAAGDVSHKCRSEVSIRSVDLEVFAQKSWSEGPSSVSQECR